MTTSLRPVESPDPPAETPRRATRARRALLPLAVLGGAAAVVALLLLTRREVEVVAPDYLPPLVRVVGVTPQTLRLDVPAEGSVEAAVYSELVAEVAGRVLELGPALEEGGFFRDGEVLLRLDDREHRVSFEKARAAVERAESEATLADLRLDRRRQLVDEGVQSRDDLDASESQARVAHATLRSARADLARAELDLERTTVRAPYAGRVSSVAVDRGQFVSRGTPLASIYAVDRAEVRLPVPDEALAHLGIPLDFQAGAEPSGPPVVLRAEVAGRDAQWTGAIDRAEGEIDPRTRMVTLVAVVDDPFFRETERGDTPPLAPGLFVQAEIEGRSVDGAVRLPSGALRAGDQVLVVDGETLRFRAVEVLRRERDTVVVGAGLAAGDEVCVSTLEAATDGMRVRRVSSP